MIGFMQKISFFVLFFLSSMDIRSNNALSQAKKSIASGLATVRLAARIEAENLINAGTVAEKPGQEPYRGKIITVKNKLKNGTMVQETTIQRDQAPFELEYNPGHPSADPNGIVKKSNVRREVVMANLNQTNLQAMALKNVYDTLKSMDNHSIDLMKG